MIWFLKVSAISQSSLKKKKKVPYLWQSEGSPSSSIWTGHLSSHHHHTPPHCCLNPNLVIALSFHCYSSFLHCVPHWTHWGTAGSSCRQVRGRARGSALLWEEISKALCSGSQGSGTWQRCLRTELDSYPPLCLSRCILTS